MEEGIIKQEIGGREYFFASLNLKELRGLKKAKSIPIVDIFDSIDLWEPYIRSSMKRAEGGLQGTVTHNEMPNLEELPLGIADQIVAQLIKAVMLATGVRTVPVGEAQPAPTTNLMTSMDSSSPQPDGVSTISTDSPSTT